MEKIDTLYKEWTGLQPLSLENQKRLDQKFMLEFNYNSNHIEGNTLTYGQTKLLLMFGETTGDAKLRDYEEMKAHNVGLELVKREAKDKERPLTENFIRELNRTILVEDFYKMSKNGGRYLVKVGQYKTRPNSVITATGEMFDYASPEETPALMTDLVKWYNEEEAKGELCPIQLATLFHYRYIRIHPFEDGNGRIARLLVNYILMRYGYPMVIVQSKDKENYLNVLHKCDIEVGLNPSDGANAQLEQVEPFLEYMEGIAKHALEMSIKAAKGESIEEEDDFAKRIALLEKEAKLQRDSKKNKTQTKADKVINILSLLYLPLRDNIVNTLKSAAHIFYQQEWDETHFSKTSDRKNASKIEKIEEWIKNANTDKKTEMLSDIKSIYYMYVLRYPKDEYKVLPSVLTIGFSITLGDEYYTISTLGNKQFSYNTYPSEKEVEKIVSKYKTEVLEKIETAIHGAE
ncbi:MAG: Fic family protein [Eubacteriales bacterium]|nr:Fic family protein [Eubacteriales bacterium]MDD4476345.1 Fic family protein [Eubacteriales bacterium]